MATGWAFDYEDIHKELAKSLLSDLWNDDLRTEFYSRFVRGGTPVGESSPPIVGVGLSESDGLPEINILTNIDSDRIDMDRYLSLRNWAGLKYKAVTSGIIRACAKVAMGGDSIGYPKGLTGTCGYMVEDIKAFGTQYMLSCSHVLAELNNGEKNRAIVLHPGPDDNGSETDRIGVLANYTRILIRNADGNRMDAGIIKPDKISSFERGIRQLGTISGVNSDPTLNTRVRKRGRSTGLTEGVLRLRNVSHIVTYDTGDEALFVEQLGIIGTGACFALRGDSGSLVIDEADRAIGLLFASCSGVDLAFCNPINPILSELGVKLYL